MKRLHYFLNHKIWTFQISKLPKRQAFPLHICRVILLTLRYFVKNKCTLHASALTFYTLLSIVPVAGMLFGIAKGYGYDEILKAKLLANMAGQRQVAEWIIQFSDNALNKASGGLVAGVGIIVLMWSALKLLASIEASFNEIWGVKQGRSMMRKISDYSTLLLLCPLLLLIVATSTAFFVTRLQSWGSSLPYGDSVWNHVMFLIAKSVPFLLTWGAFAFLYVFIPNTKVSIRAGLISGAVTGFFYTILQFVYIYAQKYLNGYNAIYGSFAAVPFFLLWLQISWTLILFGAQSTFAVQNVHDYELSAGETSNESMEYRHLCALRIMIELAHVFKTGQGGLTASQLSEGLEIPIRTTRSVLFDLYTINVATRTYSDSKREEQCQIAVPPETLTPIGLYYKLSRNGYSGYNSNSLDFVRKLAGEIRNEAELSPKNLPLSELPSYMDKNKVS